MTSVPGSLPFSEMLKRHRLANGYTQEALAERAGLTARGIQNLERGAHHPYPDTLYRLIRALALSPEEQAAFEAAAAPKPRHRAGGSSSSVIQDGRVLNAPAPLTRSSDGNKTWRR